MPPRDHLIAFEAVGMEGWPQRGHPSNSEWSVFSRDVEGAVVRSTIWLPTTSVERCPGEDVVPGTKRRRYLQENLGSLNLALQPDDLDRLSDLQPAGEREPAA